MRFLFLSQYFPPEIGAPQLRLAAIVRELKQLGHEVEVVTALPNYPTGRIFPRYRGRLYLRENRDGILIHRVWLYPAMGAGIKRFLNYLSFTVTSLFGLLHAKRPDFLFVESPPLLLGISAAFAASLWRIPVILNVADLWPDSVKELGLMREGLVLRLAEKLEAWVYRRAAFINAVTGGIQQVLIEKKKVPRQKVLFLPNGVDTELFRPMEPDLKLAEELQFNKKQIILYAGTLGYAQGLEVAIDAAARLTKELTNASLLFVGDGSEKPKLEVMARQLNLDNVHFLPASEPEYIVRLFSLAKAGLVALKDLPLFEGARPSKILTIMACGKPVIYGGRGEGARLVKEAQAGIVVPPGDPVALAKAIRYLLNHPDEAERFGANGRKFVEDNFGWSFLVKRWLNELEKKTYERN
jgi:glycosyltransferase involved in cell wall biosynthesis